MTLRRWPCFIVKGKTCFHSIKLEPISLKYLWQLKREFASLYSTFIFLHFLFWPFVTNADLPNPCPSNSMIDLNEGLQLDIRAQKRAGFMTDLEEKWVKWIERSWVRRAVAFREVRGQTWEPSSWVNTQEEIMEGFGVLWVLADMKFMDQKKE